ncbi:hypothetical protein ASZ78_005746 [Callipepla squamata]|uniref:RING-type domain-containing protein n=1 Tax=Callipepla squamata TaxID=9009 RepID=A0A226NII1_CALSU|nr:hypothetical protein ASZ78_005746 [Callipepla squamata]
MGRVLGLRSCYGCTCSLSLAQHRTQAGPPTGSGDLPAHGPGHDCCLRTDTDCGLSFLQRPGLTAGVQQGEQRAICSSPAQGTAMEAEICAICRELTPDTTVVPCEHRFCLRCILQWTLRRFTCPLCGRLMCTITCAERADGSLPCVITLPSEYEAESRDTDHLWDTATRRPTPSGSPEGGTQQEPPTVSHTAPGDEAAHPTGTPVPAEPEQPQPEPQQQPEPRTFSGDMFTLLPLGEKSTIY